MSLVGRSHANASCTIPSNLEWRSPGDCGSFMVNTAKVLFILSTQGLKEAEYRSLWLWVGSRRRRRKSILSEHTKASVCSSSWLCLWCLQPLEGCPWQRLLLPTAGWVPPVVAKLIGWLGWIRRYEEATRSVSVRRLQERIGCRMWPDQCLNVLTSLPSGHTGGLCWKGRWSKVGGS